MAISADYYNISFVLSLGDNFYPDGVSDDTDPQWESTFRQVYNSPSLDVPWFSILGNHDYHLNPDAQIAFSHRDSRWRMPGHYYRQSFGDGLLDIFFIDTIWIAPNMSNNTFISDAESKFQEQLDWLSDSLSRVSDSSSWKIVVGHYELYSIGENGDSSVMISALENILVKYGVDVYLCGHEHTLQHLVHRGIQYYISGNGAKRGILQSGDSTSMARVEYAVVDPGFMVHQVFPDYMVTTLVDHYGNHIYKHTLNKKKAMH